MKRLEYSRKTPHGTKRASQTAEFKPGTKSTCHFLLSCVWAAEAPRVPVSGVISTLH